MILRKAETVNARALPAIQHLNEQGQPFFLFIHYWDPHTPYLPPSPYRRKFYPKDRDPYDLNNHSMDEAWTWEPFKWYFHDWMPGVTDAEYVINLYDGETAYMDRHLRSVFAALAPLQQETLVIITADHGEILNEQSGYFDHHGLYEGNVHVPLLLYWPGALPRGRRVPGFVQNLDLAPTILELAGIPDRDRIEGLSLIPPIFGLRDGNYDEIYLSEATWELKRGLRTQRWKLINSLEPDRHGRPMQELFDLQSDPQEQHNVVAQHSDVAQQLTARLNRWVAQRLAETGRDVDPLYAQGICGTKIGTSRPGEVIGSGATPLHKRKQAQAATIPAPDELKAPNEMTDEAKGIKLHGYVRR